MTVGQQRTRCGDRKADPAHVGPETTPEGASVNQTNGTNLRRLFSHKWLQVRKLRRSIWLAQVHATTDVRSNWAPQACAIRLVDRRIREGTSRLDWLCTRVTIDS